MLKSRVRANNMEEFAKYNDRTTQMHWKRKTERGRDTEKNEKKIDTKIVITIK